MAKLLSTAGRTLPITAALFLFAFLAPDSFAPQRSGSTALGQAQPPSEAPPLAAPSAPTPYRGACPASASPQDWRTITFDNQCSYKVWVGAKGEGVPAPMLTAPGEALSIGGKETWCVPSPCPSCAYFPATKCTGSGASLVCDTGLNRAAPVTAAELAQGGTKTGISLKLPKPLTSPYIHFIGNGWIQPGSFTLTSDSAGMNVVARDDGKGTITGNAVAATPASSIDYLGGIYTIYFKTGEAGVTVYNNFTFLGDDTYDVSMVDGFNVPIEISPTVPAGGIIPNAARLALKPEPCVTDSNCDSGFSCAPIHQCVKKCSKDTDCGQYPNRCDTTVTPPVCVNALNTPYWCTSPGCAGGNCLRPSGCLPGDNFCATQTACNWDFGLDFAKCPSILRVRNSAGKVVGCTVPNDVCNSALPTGGYDTSFTCSAGKGPGYPGNCPAGTVCNANTDGNCYPTESCTGGPDKQGSCPNFGQICTSLAGGHCVDTFALKGGCTGGPSMQGSCPSGLTCSAASGGQCECSGGPNAQGTCPAGLTCSASANGLCVGCQGHCPPNSAPSCYGPGVCATQCSGTGRGNCPAGDACLPPSKGGGCLAGPSNAFNALGCLDTYPIKCAGVGNTCPTGMACIAGQCISNNKCTRGVACSTALDCPVSSQCLPDKPGSGTKHCYGGCPAGDYSVCDPVSLKCMPSNTTLYAAVGPAILSCQIVSGAYNACFSNYDCPPGALCDLAAGDPNQFTCIDSSTGAKAYDCGSAAYAGFPDCPGQGVTTAGTCGAPPAPWPTLNNKCVRKDGKPCQKCVAIGGHSCTKDSDCPSAGSGNMICKGGQCVWPPWCGGPLNPQWNAVVKNRAGNFATVFKAVCPTSYPFQYDDPTATMQCEQSAAGFNSASANTKKVPSLGYQITFCPAPPKP
jgi:hypothetical protein